MKNKIWYGLFIIAVFGAGYFVGKKNSVLPEKNAAGGSPFMPSGRRAR